jgi:hypothetical protein
MSLGTVRGADLEAGEAMADVRGVADLAHLAVAHHVDTGSDLLLHDVGDRDAHRRVERLRVMGLVAILREQPIDDLLRSREAADVRRENTLGAAAHR